VTALQSLRRTFYYYDPNTATRAFYFRNRGGNLTPLAKRNLPSPPPDVKELDALILDALRHAKRMMSIVRELNEALDEFEEQFNLPRFEPNSIDESNSVDSNNKEDF